MKSMLRILLLIGFLLVDTFTAAQEPRSKRFDPWASEREITFSAGIHQAGKGINSDGAAAIRVDYVQFGRLNFGWRAGLQYLGSYRDIPNGIELPVRFGWRSPLARRGRWANDAIEASIEELSLWPLIASALIPQRIEFNVGITPGYLFGRQKLDYIEPYDGSRAYETGLVKRHNFTCSLDVGAKVSYRIWRFTFSFLPEFHYYLTDNVRTYDSREPAAGCNPGRVFFSWMGGLGFMF